MGIARTSNVIFFGLSLLFSAVAISAEMTESAQIALGRRVAEMFQAGVVGKPRAMQESQRIYESLCHETGNNPRIDYAHALVLMKLMKSKEAQAQFLAATKRPGTAYFPAWQALIWSYFNAKEYDDGYERLVEYAKLILDPERTSIDLRRDEIYWIGRLMSALELILNSPQGRESWMQMEKRLTDLFDVELIDAYNDGKEDMHIKHAAIEDKIRHDHEKAEEQKAQKRDKELERKGKLLEAAGENSENLKKSASEAKETMEEQSATYKKQMQRAEKDIAFLERRATVLTAEMLVLDQQINVLEQTSKNQNPTVNTGNAQRLNVLQNSRYLKDLEFQRITALAQDVTSNAGRLTEQRSEFIDQNQKEAGELALKDKINEKIKERTLRQVADLKKAEANAKAPAASKLIPTRTLRTYIDFDLVAERERLLDSFGIKAEKK